MQIPATLTSSPVRCWMTQHRNSSEESLQCGLGLYVARATQKSAMKECIAVTHAEANVLYQVDYSTVTVSKCLDVQYRYFFFASLPLIAVDGGNLFFCFFFCLSVHSILGQKNISQDSLKGSCSNLALRSTSTQK